MEKTTLKNLIFKNYLKTALTSLLLIEVVLIVIYFNANNSMLKATTDFIIQDIKKSVYSRVDSATHDVEHRFEDIENNLRFLQNEQQNFFQYYENIELKQNPQFKIAHNGMFYKSKDNGGSSVVVSKNTVITPKLKQKLINSELFDANFKNMVENNDMVIAAYFNSHDNMNRYYPFIENSFDAFPADIQMNNYNFYYKANFNHNPKKEVVWTEVYLDPAGQGWMISAIVPIYRNNFLEGVTGFDVTIDAIIKNFLSFKLPYEGTSFLMADNGKVIAMTQEIAKTLNLSEFKKYIYSQGEKIDNTIYKDDGINLLDYKDRDFKENIRKIIDGEKYSHNITLNGKNYLLFTHEIEKTSWYLVSMIDEALITEEVRSLEEYYDNLGYLIVAFIVLFYILFSIYLYKKSHEFVAIINAPLLKIIDITKYLGVEKKIEKIENCGIEELDKVSENFNELSTQLEQRTQKLVESELQRKHNERMANTDAMTEVYNRRFLEDFSQKYMQIVKREKSDFAMLLIDIDNFKTINDTYGHDFGDTIIKEMVRILQDEIRENDMIVRLGGDEFVVLLPNTNLDNAYLVAKKLNEHINSINQLKSKKLQFTMSIGCSAYENSDDNIDQLIKRADIALYKSKEAGKNCVH